MRDFLFDTSLEDLEEALRGGITDKVLVKDHLHLGVTSIQHLYADLDEQIVNFTEGGVLEREHLQTDEVQQGGNKERIRQVFLYLVFAFLGGLQV